MEEEKTRVVRRKRERTQKRKKQKKAMGLAILAAATFFADISTVITAIIQFFS